MARKPKPDRKNSSLSFRVPKRIRNYLKWACRYTEQSQGDFVMEACETLLRRILAGEPLLDMLLSEGFEIPHDGSKMIAFRMRENANEEWTKLAARLYHKGTGYALWAVCLHIKECRDRFNRERERKEIAELTASTGASK